MLGADPDAMDADGISPLGWACLRSRIPTMVVLLDKGATIGELKCVLFFFIWFKHFIELVIFKLKYNLGMTYTFMILIIPVLIFQTNRMAVAVHH